MIKGQIEASRNDKTFLAINTSRKAAMNNVWFLLIWLFAVAIEGFTFSLTLLLVHGPDCEPVSSSGQTVKEVFQFIDKLFNFQSWFIPMIWLYWPTKARKKENRTRKKAIDQLKGSIIIINNSADTAGEECGETGADFSEDGYSSLDADESYLDYDHRSDNSVSFVDQTSKESMKRSEILRQPGMERYSSELEPEA